MHAETMARLGVDRHHAGTFAGEWIESSDAHQIESINPTTGEPLGSISATTENEYELVITRAQEAFEQWRSVPAPQRGEYVRQIGEALRDHKSELGSLVTAEVGKITAEGEGEVQEAIDMADFAVGLSRQLYGLTMASERPHHRLFEQWHPLGPVGVITAFNFPVAVWSWNAFVAAVCGDAVIWKPSSHAPLTSVAITRLCAEVMDGTGFESVFSLVSDPVGRAMVDDRRIPLISATGSTEMGRDVSRRVSDRLGRSLLELGGNNAAIVMGDADVDLVTRAVVFGAVGTAGQRCTTLRRLLVHDSIAEEIVGRLKIAYETLPIGDPSHQDNLVGPLITNQAMEDMQRALAEAVDQGGHIITGGEPMDSPGYFVQPAIVWIEPTAPITHTETFAPILYMSSFATIEDAIAAHNAVPQGLSSAIFTDSLKAAERFLSASGSDCGIANVNAGTSGAEIGGAFGGEKDTGGGRESGSDSWKAYMRRQTVTLNWGDDLPLAQGIDFG